MNNHEDNLRDLVITYCGEHGLEPEQIEMLLEDHVTDKAQAWLDTKTETSIKGIEYE